MKIRILNKADDLLSFKDIRIEGAYDAPIAFRASPQEMESRTLEDFENHLNGANSSDFIVGAFLDDALIGVAALYHQKIMKLAHKAEIGSVYVKPEYRNTGIAKTLLIDIIDRAKEAGVVRQINLSVCTINEPAIRVYKSLGFVCYGSEPNSVEVDGKFYDEHLMQLIV